MSTPLVDLIQCPYGRECGSTLAPNDFDTDASRYYFHSLSIIAKIHLRSDTLFHNVNPLGALDCAAINQQVNGDKFDCSPFLDRVPCTNQTEFLFGNYYKSSDEYSDCNFQNALYGAVCCTDKYDNKCDSMTCMPYWSDQVKQRCKIGNNVEVRCPDDRCIYNQSENICWNCSTTGGCGSDYTYRWRDTAWYGGCIKIEQDKTTCATPNANYASLRDWTLANPGSGIGTIEIYQDISNLSSVGLGDTLTLSKTANWRKDVFEGQCNAFLAPKTLPSVFALPLFTMSFMLCIVHVFYYECYGRVSVENNSFYNTCAYLDGTPALLDYLRFLMGLASYSGMNKNVPYWDPSSGFQNPEWWTVSNALCRLPTFSTEGDHTVVSLTMPFALYKSQILDAPTAEEASLNMTRMMSMLLDEGSSKVVDFTTGVSSPVA